MATIQGVYVALFGRPADPTGLSFFNSATNNGANLNAIGNLASTAEYQARFAGLNNVQIINSIYQSLFGRDADLTGLNFFSDALAKGTLNINNIAIAILDGAQGNDKTIVTNKVAAADLYTAALDTGTEVVAYSGLAAAAQGRAFITGVTTTVPTKAAVDASVAAMVTTSGSGGTGTVGVTLTLAAGADTISPNSATEATKTTAGNDTLRAVTAGDLGTSDSIDGGAGTDTLNAAMALGAVTVAPVLKNVENVNLTYGTLTGASVFNAADSTGIQKLSAIDAVTTGQSLTISNVEKSTVVELKNITGDGSGDVVVSFKDVGGTADAATVSLAKVTTGLDLTVAGIETLTLNSTGATGDTNTAILDTADLKALVVTGTNNLTIDQSAAGTSVANLKSVDASAFTGSLTYTASANGETITGGSKVDSITLGAGADVVVYKAGNVSTINAIETIGSFNFAADKIDLKAFGLAATTTVGATAVAAAGDIAGFFSGTNSVLLNDGTDTVYVDINKDGNFNAGTDLAVVVTGATAANFTTADLILA